MKLALLFYCDSVNIPLDKLEYVVNAIKPETILVADAYESFIEWYAYHSGIDIVVYSPLHKDDLPNTCYDDIVVDSDEVIILWDGLKNIDISTRDKRATIIGC